jgi:hypothetical protein
MSIASSPPEESEEIHGPGLPKRIRLSEVGQIAAERLDGVAEGSLQEALALRPPDPSAAAEPTPVGLVEGKISSLSAAAAPAHPHPPQAEGTDEPLSNESELSRAIEPPSFPEMPEVTPVSRPSTNGLDAAAAAAESAIGEPASHSPRPRPDIGGDGAVAASAWPPALPGVATETEAALAAFPADADAHPSSLAADADTATHAAAAEATAFVAPPLFSTEPAAPLRSFAEAHGAVQPAGSAPEAGDGSPEPSLPAATPSQAADPNLANALGAAAKLAADATAAAEAIENLKRLLERQMPLPAQAPRQPLHEVFAEHAGAAEPPPLPHHAPAPEPEMEADRLPMPPTKPMPRPGAKRSAWRERQQFDFRGFMAGFALSWAIGAVLYIYLTAG